MTLQIPAALKAEHDELHAELVRATKAGGRTGEAARAVADLLHPHFVKEEAYALPPLGLLHRLSQGQLDQGMAEVLPLTDRLKAELPQMLAEHRSIVAALEQVIEAARTEKHADHERFAHQLIAHAQTEEQVSYPAALLVGIYVRQALGQK